MGMQAFYFVKLSELSREETLKCALRKKRVCDICHQSGSLVELGWSRRYVVSIGK